MPFDGRILSGVGVLAAVVEGGSFVKAADLVGITDSGVSRAIGRLEARLGIRLLDRTTRSVVLTDEGRRFFEAVKPHLLAIEDASILASGAASVIRGRLRVDIDPFFLPAAMAGRLGPFCDRHPDLVVELVSRGRTSDLVADGIDLAIRFGQPTLATAVSRKLIDAPILTVAAPAYLERHGLPTHPSDLTAHRCLQFLDPMTGRRFGWEFVRGRETLAVDTAGPLVFTDPAAMLLECVAGTGVAQVIGWGVRDRLDRGELIDLFPEWHGESFPLYAVHPSRNHPPAKVRAFLQFCLELVATL